MNGPRNARPRTRERGSRAALCSRRDSEPRQSVQFVSFSTAASRLQVSALAPTRSCAKARVSSPGPVDNHTMS